jgi:hyperosmotically inducible protein
LRGEVDSAEDKAEAVRIARATEGVTKVEDHLRVKGAPAEATGAAAAPAGAEEGTNQPDSWLTAKVQAKYFMDREVKASDIDVDTQGGVVTLKGTVETEAERRQAVALARNTDGVKSVTDQLQVQPDTGAGATGSPATKIPPVEPVVDDTWITTKIQSKYFLDQQVKGHQINVDTQKGVVTLKGTVDTEGQKKEAERIASETDGVSKVINNLIAGQR